MNEKNMTASKRHCMVVHAFYPLGETRVQREALALVNQGYQVDVICLRGENEPPSDEEDGVRIYRLPMKRYRGHGLLVQLLEYLVFFMLAFVKIAGLHLKESYNTVQVHNLPDFLVFAALIPKLTGAKIILDLHDLMPEFFAAKSGKRMSSLMVRLVIWQEGLSCHFADQVITVTDVWRGTLIERGVPAHKVSVVMNVADARIFNQVVAKKTPEKQGEGLNLIYHGTFTHRYGVDLIIQAVDKLRSQIPGLHLTLLGNGETWDELIALTKELGLEDQVKICSTLHADELPAYIRQSDIGIVPNRSNIFTDGLLPTKMMEYVAMGIPIIAAKTPTIQAYFDDTMVRFFTPGDADDLAQCIFSLYKNRQSLESIALNANKFNLTYSWDKVAANYFRLVDSLNQAQIG
jgi:glycosyltransferase involved in cell wall biosynthesis